MAAVTSMQGIIALSTYDVVSKNSKKETVGNCITQPQCMLME